MSNLSPFFEAIADIPEKNRGGCLYFCWVFWLWLKEQGMSTETFQIKQTSGPWGGQEPITHNLKWIDTQGNANFPPRSSYHFTWLYEGKEYDAEGPHCEPNGVILSGLNSPVSEPMVDKFCIEALNKGSWNSYFDRDHAIDMVMVHPNLNLDTTAVRR